MGFFVSQRYALKMLLILAGDIELCPGPGEVICMCCSKIIRKKQSQGSCGRCKKILHLKCLVDRFNNGVEKVVCPTCFDMPTTFEENCTSSMNYNISGHLNDYLHGRGMKLLHQNVNGLLAKMDQIRVMFKETNRNIHIFGVTETHANEDLNDNQLCLNGYTLVRKDCESGHGDSVCCFIRNHMNWHRRTDLEVKGLECLWIEVFIQDSKSFLIGIIYRPPDSSQYTDKDFTTKFTSMLETSVCENKEVILTGDLDCNYLIPNDHKTINLVN